MPQCSTDANAAKSLIVAANRLAQQATCEMTDCGAGARGRGPGGAAPPPPAARPRRPSDRGGGYDSASTATFSCR
jgi:hypothetical protein